MEVYYPFVAMGIMFLALLLLREYDKRNLVKHALDDPETVKKIYELIQRENARRRLSGSANAISNPQTQRRGEQETAQKPRSTLRKGAIIESFERAEKEGDRLKKQVKGKLDSLDE